MEKDYQPSTKYTDEELDELQISYVMKDSCQDQLADYRLCCNTSKWSFLPNFNRYGPCRALYDRWIICQSNREFEIQEKRRSSLKIVEETGKRD